MLYASLLASQMEQRQIFSEQEATEILKTAAKLSEQADGSVPYKAGITFEELSRMAEDMGIDPAMLQRALKAPTSKDEKSKMGFSQTLERVIEGEIPRDEFDELYLALTQNSSQVSNRATGMTQVGGTLTGQVMTGPANADVDIISKNGRTRLRVLSKNVLGTVFGIQLAFFGCLAAFGSIANGAPLGATALPIGAALGYALYRWFAQIGHKKARELFERLSETAEALANRHRNSAG